MALSFDRNFDRDRRRARSIGFFMNELPLPFEEVKPAFNNFADENLLLKYSPSSSSYSVPIYKSEPIADGKRSVNLIARKIGLKHGQFFMNEIRVCHMYMHKNMVPTYGISGDDDDDVEEIIIINKYEENESLDKHLGGSTLAWIQRLHICLRVAHTLRYLHDHEVEEDNNTLIHGNIKSSKILLDKNWEPKLNGFGFSMRVKKHQPYIISEYKGTLQYMDPAYENSRCLSHKSDVFSFGVVLFEVLFGIEAASFQDEDHWYFARLARSHYEKETLDDMIDPDLRSQMDLKSLEIFSKLAYYCLKEMPSERPDMIQVVKKLETAFLLQQKHETPEQLTASVETTSSNHFEGENLDHLKIQLADIKLATNNFSETFCIGSGGYGRVYKAKLYHFDGINLSSNKGEPPKKDNIVAIKRISSRVDEQGEQGFIAEIELLSKCKHPNIVSLLGFCDEGPEMILVYEYASNGSLDDYLGNDDNLTCLSWSQRIQICLDVAYGLNYLHTSTKDKKSIIHRDIKSANILLDRNWVAKIADFGLSKLHHKNEQRSTLITCHIAGTDIYLDPEYRSTGKLKTKSDIYSLGVLLFEIMCGRLAYDNIYEKGLPAKARQCFKEGTLYDMVDPKIRLANDNIFTLNGGLNGDSFDIFSKIAYQCIAETQSSRPTLEVVIQELEKAFNFQKNSKGNLHIPFEDIKCATQNFSDERCIGEGRHWKQYEAQFPQANGLTTLIAKRWYSKSRQAYHQFLKELKALFQKKHENIVALVGYCNEMDENIIVYEHASRGRLDKYLNDANVTWMKRLKIGINVASGLEFIHKEGATHEQMMHRDLKSVSILIDSDWNAKISNLELSMLFSEQEKVEHVTDDNDYGSLGYVCPEYKENGYLNLTSDIYSLGVILMEMLCGRLAWGEGCEDHSQSLVPLAKRHYKEKGNLDELVFEDIKEQISVKSLSTFADLVMKCLANVDLNGARKVHAGSVVKLLKEALEFQEDYEIWAPKIPKDCKKIFNMSKNPEIYNSFEMKKDLYDMLSKGILLQEGKLLFSLGNNGEKNEMISAKRFSYKNHLLLKWRSISESRFQKVAKMFDYSKLNIQIKIRTQLLSPCVSYKVHLIFKFCGPRKFQAKRMYVNLKYKKGNESLHAYFATRRQDGWMMIELFQFFNYKEETDFEVLLEGFSRCYYGKHSIYIEGIEFKAIDNVTNEDIKKLKDVQQVLKLKSKMVEFSLTKTKVEKDHILSAVKVVYDSSNVAIQSRFAGSIEFLQHQVFRIKCKIESQLLSKTTKNVCYLVFKLSDKFCELNGPVIVRDLLHWRSKETGVLYFRSPSPWNLYDTDWVPRVREDGWMEVIVWKYNPNYELRNDCLFVNLKLTTYEGTMAGLIVRGIEFRPM